MNHEPEEFNLCLGIAWQWGKGHSWEAQISKPDHHIFAATKNGIAVHIVVRGKKTMPYSKNAPCLNNDQPNSKTGVTLPWLHASHPHIPQYTPTNECIQSSLCSFTQATSVNTKNRRDVKPISAAAPSSPTPSLP